MEEETFPLNDYLVHSITLQLVRTAVNYHLSGATEHPAGVEHENGGPFGSISSVHSLGRHLDSEFPEPVIKSSFTARFRKSRNMNSEKPPFLSKGKHTLKHAYTHYLVSKVY